MARHVGIVSSILNPYNNLYLEHLPALPCALHALAFPWKGRELTALSQTSSYHLIHMGSNEVCEKNCVDVECISCW